MNRQLLSKIYAMYRDCQVGWSENCKECQSEFMKLREGKELTGPVPIYHVGSKYSQDQYRVLILGAATYGWDEDTYIQKGNAWRAEDQFSSLYEPIENRVRSLFLENNMPYWNYVRSICKVVDDNLEKAYDRIAISNMIKCNNLEVSLNKLPSTVISHCCNSCHNFMIAGRESLILSPKHIILLWATELAEHFQYIDGWNNETMILTLRHPSRSGKSMEWFAKQVKMFISGDLENFRSKLYQNKFQVFYSKE